MLSIEFPRYSEAEVGFDLATEFLMTKSATAYRPQLSHLADGPPSSGF